MSEENMKMHIIKIDENAYTILQKVKEELRKQGRAGVSFSDCIRYMHSLR